MKITILEPNDKSNFIVIIGNDVFEMSNYPDRANEVNIYMGEISTDWEWYKLTQNTTQIKKIPGSMKYAIRKRCIQLRHELITKPEHDGKVILQNKEVA